jgi:hypothetical protein
MKLDQTAVVVSPQSNWKAMLSPSGSVAVALKVTGTPATPALGPEMTGTVGGLLKTAQVEPSITAAPTAAATQTTRPFPYRLSKQVAYFMLRDYLQQSCCQQMSCCRVSET